MTFAPRDVVALVFAVALAVALDAVVLSLVVRGELGSDVEKGIATLGSAFMAAIVVWYRRP